MLSSAVWSSDCVDHDATITIDYRLRDPKSPYEEDSVLVAGPGIYVVAGSPLIISDPAPDLRPHRKSWFKRLWEKIF
ncbi:MAG: hypothetical protein WB992_08300 [Bryobacteraceae bacterium]